MIVWLCTTYGKGFLPPFQRNVLPPNSVWLNLFRVHAECWRLENLSNIWKSFLNLNQLVVPEKLNFSSTPYVTLIRQYPRHIPMESTNSLLLNISTFPWTKFSHLKDWGSTFLINVAGKKRITLCGTKTKRPSPEYLLAIRMTRPWASQTVDYSIERLSVTGLIGKVWMEVVVA